MSGLEIIALLPTIISAFGAISVEYREWRKQRADRAHQRRNLHLQRSLAGNVGAVQGEFDEALRAVGPALRKGDGVAREALMNHLIVLQSTVISLLRDRQNVASYLIHPNHDSIHSTTSSTRDGIVTALSEQCQRLAQAKPIARIQAPTPHTPVQSTENCLNALKCEYVESEPITLWTRLLLGGLDVVPSSRAPRKYYCFNCDRCKWHGMHDETWPIPTTRDGGWLDVKLVLDRFHYHDSVGRRKRMGFRCYICRENFFGDGAMGRWEKVVMHIREMHCLEEFQLI
ncbi:hypothetical protein BJX66DRAFT_306601 [Aspergillus keveii]|uniref:C2H2-type domain-containing protein n=1 Tax=Aspergillus keveii TaxID=714993 RepID=A0ABR4G217_9EURO